MKVAEAIWIAMPWAATGTVPRLPIIKVEARKSPLSLKFVRPIGHPK